MKRKNWKSKAIVAVGVMITPFMGGLVIWTAVNLGPSEFALSMQQSDSEIRIIREADLIVFEPAASQPTTGFIVYPGAQLNLKSLGVVLGQQA